MRMDSGSHVISTLYVSHQLDLPIRTAVAAFDALRSQVPTMAVASVELRLGDRVHDHRSDGVDDGARTVTGVLTSDWWTRIPVELDVTPWSSTRSEIGLRPRGRRVRLDGGHRQHCYVAAATTLTTALADGLERHVNTRLVTELDGVSDEVVAAHRNRRAPRG